MRQPGQNRQVSSVRVINDSDIRCDVLNAHSGSMRAMSACGDLSTVRHSRHYTTGSAIVRTGITSHNVLHDGFFFG